MLKSPLGRWVEPIASTARNRWYPIRSQRLALRPSKARLNLECLEGRCLLSEFTLGPLVQVSHYDPFAGCTADDPAHQSGTLYPNTELEPRLAVDPTNPDHLVGTWQQDRWSNGGSRGLVAGVSLDGGLRWEEVVIAGLSKCSGGSSTRASDPWISFAPNGDVYHISLSVSDSVLVSKSIDGGFTWGVPIALSSGFNDKETITADPTDERFVYAVWNLNGQETFARTTNGGQTWEAARPIGGRVLDSHLLILPDGTLVDVYSSGPRLLLMRSTDKGKTWGSPTEVARPQPVGVRDPDTGQPVRTFGGGVFDIAADASSGNLYAVWEDARFSQFQHNSIAFAMSSDGGFTWSAPVQVNQTPTEIRQGNQQAFLPSVQVALDGTVAVTYYDFRFDDPKPGLPTDYWFVHGTPNDSGDIDWGDELRLTDESFDMARAPDAGGLFVGDYQGLGAAGNSFVAFFAHPHPGGRDSVFSRRVDATGPKTLAAEMPSLLTLAGEDSSGSQIVATIPASALFVKAGGAAGISVAMIAADRSPFMLGARMFAQLTGFSRRDEGNWSFTGVDLLFACLDNDMAAG